MSKRKQSVSPEGNWPKAAHRDRNQFKFKSDADVIADLSAQIAVYRNALILITALKNYHDKNDAKKLAQKALEDA